jgi:hypothetical protein
MADHVGELVPKRLHAKLVGEPGGRSDCAGEGLR